MNTCVFDLFWSAKLSNFSPGSGTEFHSVGWNKFKPKDSRLLIIYSFFYYMEEALGIWGL